MSLHIYSLRNAILACCGGALLASGLAGPIRAEDNSSAVVSESMALRHGLKRSMLMHLDVDGARDSLAYIGQNRQTLFLQSKQGLLYCVDAETGQTVWQTSLAEGGIVFQPMANDHFVAAASGATIYLLNRETGEVQWKQSLDATASAGPAINDEYVYVPLSSGQITILPIAPDKKHSPSYCRSYGKLTGAPIVTRETVAWTTEDGTLAVYRVDTQKTRFQFQPGGAVAAPPGYHEGTYFVGSLDGYVYAVSEQTGSTTWQFATSNEIRQPPVALGDLVFVVSEGSGLHCLAAASGEEKWFAPGIRRFEAQSPTKVYAEDRLGRLAIIDLESGGVVDTVALGGSLALRPANVQSDRLILASASGIVESLHEAELGTPEDYLPPPPEPVADEEKPTHAPTAATATAGKAAEPAVAKKPKEPKAAPVAKTPAAPTTPKYQKPVKQPKVPKKLIN